MLARDVAPDRLTRAKQILTRIIDERKEDQVALIVFAVKLLSDAPYFGYAIGKIVFKFHRSGVSCLFRELRLRMLFNWE